MALANYIWFEKYRPQKLKDLSLNKQHKVAFKRFIEDSDMPHLLLEGPKGSGKTTLAYLLIGNIPSVCITLNASGKERGIDTIRETVTTFASSQPPKGKIKIVFLDEADRLTPTAQDALRNTMETHSKSCKFILTCNYVDKIEPPIQSRCIKYTFNQFPATKVVALAKSILKQEKITNFDDDDLKKIIGLHYPDIRSVINTLQSCCVSGKFDIEAIHKASADPVAVCKAVAAGHMFTARSLVAGVTDFMFIYRHMIDEWLPTVDEGYHGPIVMGIGEAVRHENTVPDRELNFATCMADICETLGVSPTMKK